MFCRIFCLSWNNHECSMYVTINKPLLLLITRAVLLVWFSMIQLVIHIYSAMLRNAEIQVLY